METINQIISFADSMFQRLPQQIMPINSMALVSVIILSVFFTVPNRIVETIAFTTIGVLILFAPNYAVVLFVLWCGLVGLGRSRKRSALLEKKLEELGRAVRELKLAENRRFLKALNSSSRPENQMQEDAPSITPSEKTDIAKKPSARAGKAGKVKNRGGVPDVGGRQL
jgi:hypothetical protein